MPQPLNAALYAKAKKMADAVYDRPSAYKSGFIVKKYKEMGGKYKDDGQEKKTEEMVQGKMGGCWRRSDLPRLPPNKEGFKENATDPWRDWRLEPEKTDKTETDHKRNGQTAPFY